MKPPILTNPSLLRVSGTMPSWYPKKIGQPFRKHSTCSPYLVRESLFVKGWIAPWMNVTRSWTGDMEAGLHQASPEGRKETGLQRPQTKSPGTVGADYGRPLPQAASV